MSPRNTPKFSRLTPHKLTTRYAALGLFLVSLFILLFDSYHEQKSTILNNYSTTFESKVQSSIGVYRKFSHYVFKQIERDKEIVPLFAAAAYSGEEVRDKNRQRIYQLLKKDYALLKEYNFRQLHFHFKNGDSFLRVHKPEKFGDNLFSIRESVRLANVEERFVEGFEEGRIFNGYRFVYPVVDHDKQVGTLEVSLSMGSIVDLLFELYPDDDFHFIINKSTVESKLFDDMAYNYLNSFLSDNYYFDKAVFEQHLPKIKYRDLLDNADTLKKSLSSLTLYEHSFSHDITIGDNTYILSFLSIKNIKGEHVAYLISSTQDARLKELCNSYLIYLLLILLVSAVTAWSIFASHRHNQRLTTASNTDFLTQVFNRNKFTEHLQYEFVQGKNLTSTFSIILFDVDHFKSINDQFGHNVGDVYLKELSELVSNRIRHSDILARWGGEEFIILLPNTSEDNGVKVAESIRKETESFLFSPGQPLTISLGVAELHPSDKNIDSIVDRADEALYTSKRQGRNQTTKWSEIK